jgi:hypothetical protein
MAGYGVALSCVYLVNLMWVKFSTEKLYGVCARLREGRNYRPMRLAYYRTLGTTLTGTLVGFLVWVRADLVLLGVGFDKEVSWNAAVSIWTMMPYIFLFNYGQC